METECKVGTIKAYPDVDRYPSLPRPKERRQLMPEEEGKDGGASGNIQELECGCCSGCCGIPVGGQLDPTEEKSPP